MPESKAHKINKEIGRIQKESLNPLYSELREYQSKCKHKRAVKESGASTGGWCEEDDSYFYRVFCPTCLRYWCIYSDDESGDYYSFCRNLKDVEEIDTYKRDFLVKNNLRNL